MLQSTLIIRQTIAARARSLAGGIEEQYHSISAVGEMRVMRVIMGAEDSMDGGWAPI